MVSPESSEFSEALRAILLRRSRTDERSLARAGIAARETGERLDRVLVSLGLVNESEMAVTLAELLGYRFVDDAHFPASAILADVLPPKFLKANKLLPVAETDGELTLAMADPFNGPAAEAAAYAAGRQVIRVVATQAAVERAIERLYAEPAGAVTREANGSAETGREDAERLRDLASEAPVIKLVNDIIARAVEIGASDVHVEPEELQVRVRYRVDGALRTARTLPRNASAALGSRIKVMARLDIAERRLPQDGRIRTPVRGKLIDLRVSSMPTLHGESIVMRILDRATLPLDLAALGFSQDLLEQFTALLKEPNGVILVTGPTGSGKTTTLYAALASLLTGTTKIYSVEDPVEYELAGVCQTHVKPQIGLSFASALRSILRQDPDVIMIGEIRDLETAEIAIQSALTGHLVFSTLHTNSAAASLTRLLDMGVEEFLLASAVRGILAQRLVRKLCQSCAQPMAPSEELAGRLLKDARSRNREGLEKLRMARGCAACQGTGFSGRTTISEMLVVSAPIREMILKRAPESAIEDAARSAGMRTLYQDGLEKVLCGATTLEEVLRITRMVD
jgi:general secretion pathway protein E